MLVFESSVGLVLNNCTLVKKLQRYEWEGPGNWTDLGLREHNFPSDAQNSGLTMASADDDFAAG